MALNSINTNIGAYYAQSNIGKASSMASSAISRLSSGNRIVQAKDDVAAMSAGTSLRTNVTTLRMALINTSQGASLLQVADGALGQITDILQRQKAISVQAGSGSLTNAERGFLNQEFQNLSQEIDRLVGQTNFNGVELLNGSTSETVAATDVQDAAKSGGMSITWDSNATFIVGATINVNGTLFTAVAGAAVPTAVQFNIAGSINQTLINLANQLNASTVTTVNGMTYSASGNTLNITAKNGGEFAGDFSINSQISNFTKAASYSGGGASSLLKVFATGTIVAADVNTSVVAAAATATQQIKAGNMTLKVGAGAAVNIALVAGDTLSQVVQRINAATAGTGVQARITGSAGLYNIELESNFADAVVGVTDDIAVTFVATDASVTVTASANTTTTQLYTLSGGSNYGIGKGDVVGVGTMGNSILVGQAQSRSELSIILPEIADANLLTAANFGVPAATPRGINLVMGSTTKTFSWTTGGSGPMEAAIGGSLSEALDNMVNRLNAYAAGAGTKEEDYALSQVEFYRSGNSIIARSKDADALVSNLNATNFSIAASAGGLPTGSTVTNGGLLNNGLQTGITTSGVTNKDFIGTLSGFTAVATGTNAVTLSVKVGDFTYTGLVTNTNPTANTTVRLSSDTVGGKNGGYFDIDLAASQGVDIVNASDSANASSFANLINAAASSLTFYQNHEISSYSGNAPVITNGVATGTLIGTSFDLKNDDFTSLEINSIEVNAPKGSNPNGSLSVTINGEKYTTATNLGDTFGAKSVFELVNENDANKVLTFRTGTVAIDIDTTDKAAAFEAALKNAFGVGEDGAAASLKFQVGTTTNDTLEVSISNVSTDRLFGGVTLDVLTAANAATASDAIDLALNMVTSARAEVGALQSRFDFASANVESSIQNQDAARGVLLDTDIAAESTAFSQAQVKLQAGIAVLAQANLLPQNLLKLIG